MTAKVRQRDSSSMWLVRKAAANECVLEPGMYHVHIDMDSFYYNCFHRMKLIPKLSVVVNNAGEIISTPWWLDGHSGIQKMGMADSVSALITKALVTPCARSMAQDVMDSIASDISSMCGTKTSVRHRDSMLLCTSLSNVNKLKEVIWLPHTMGIGETPDKAKTDCHSKKENRKRRRGKMVQFMSMMAVLMIYGMVMKFISTMLSPLMETEKLPLVPKGWYIRHKRKIRTPRDMCKIYGMKTGKTVRIIENEPAPIPIPVTTPVKKPVEPERVPVKRSIVAYRVWAIDVSLGTSSPRLVGAYGMTWNAGIMRAKCEYGLLREHLLRDEHSCGIYGARKLSELKSIHSWKSPVFGRVHLWGAIVEGEDAHRAEYAMIDLIETLRCGVCSKPAIIYVTGPDEHELIGAMYVSSAYCIKHWEMLKPYAPAGTRVSSVEPIMSSLAGFYGVNWTDSLGGP